MSATAKTYKDLAPVIAASWFTVDEALHVYASVSEVPEPEKHLLIVRDGTETTVVTKQSNLPLPGCLRLNKDRWKLINIRCGNPFYCVGFIAAITDALAAAGIDIVIISSFSNDLILVMEADAERAAEVLVEIGFEQR